LVVWPEGIQNSRTLHGVEEGDESVDSVYEALVGQSARKRRNVDDTELLVSDITEHLSDVEDTFVGRQQASLAGSKISGTLSCVPGPVHVQDECTSKSAHTAHIKIKKYRQREEIIRYALRDS
jgi:hypothetical protein